VAGEERDLGLPLLIAVVVHEFAEEALPPLAGLGTGGVK